MKTTTNIGELNGQMANNIHNFVLIAELLTKLTESRLQADFYATTGMRCNRKVRMLMEKLMEDHGFTAHELKRPWRTGALVPDGNEGNIKGAQQVFDAVYGWGGLAFATLMYFAVAMVCFVSVSRGSPFYLQGTLIFSIASSVYICALAYLTHLTVIPQRTAKKVLRAIQENGKANALIAGQVEVIGTPEFS